MGEETRSTPREFQLETRHLAAIIFVIALLCIFSFLFGRWVERQAYRATPGGQMRGGASESLSVEDVNRELTYFRTLDGTAQPPGVAAPQPESRSSPVVVQAPPPPPQASEAPAPASPAFSPPAPATPPASGGGVMIQVLATKDRAAAKALKDRLLAKGYSVSVVVGSAPAEAGWRKVRVGPFASRAEADKAARKLQAEEGVRTWIP